MSSTSFTFLNATGTPGLSQLAAKRMRAHITKTNFAKRRQRIAEAKPNDVTAGRKAQESLIRSVITGANFAAGLPLATQPTDPYSYAQYSTYTSALNRYYC